jgi:DNA-binding response OmpR family regulator
MGAKATDVFKKIKPNICVLDIMLPNKDGFTIADEIRELDEEVPIIFLTAKIQTEDVVKGFSLGGNDYIRKPFSMEELIVRVQNALRIKTEDSKKITGDSFYYWQVQFPGKQTGTYKRERRPQAFIPGKRIAEAAL